MSKLKLPRLPRGWQDQPVLVERYWDEMAKRLEASLNSILAIPAIQAALDGLQTDLDSLQTDVTATAQETSLVNSYPSNYTAPLISASSSGSITIANHDRVYGDSVLNPTVSVTGSTFSSGASVGQIVRVYYLDADKSGGAVTYLFTIDPAAPVAQGNGYHSIGAVVIPASGTGGGGGVTPPGYVEP